MKILKNSCRIKKILVLALCLIALIQAFPKTYSSKSGEISITVNNLRTVPTSVKTYEDVRVWFNYTFSLTSSAESRWFKANDTIVVETNFDNLMTNRGHGGTFIYDNAENLLGEVFFKGNKMIYVVSSRCEELRYASLFGEIHTDQNYSAPYVAASTDLTLKVENKTTTLTVNALQVRLQVSSSGLGTTTWSSSSPINSTITLTDGESVTITATPNADTSLHFINLGRADGQSIILWNTKTKQAQTVTISFSDLRPGLNTVRVQYSDKKYELIPGTNSNGNWGHTDWRTIFFKDVWGVDNVGGLPSANNDIYINENTMLQLYQSCGATINENNLITNVFFEDSIPGNEEVSLLNGAPAIYAILPWYEIDTNGCYKAFNPERGRYGDWYARVGAAGQTNLVANGMLARVQQTSTDTKDVFRERVKNTPLSYGVFKDPVSLSTFIFANLGSPGDPDGPGFYCSDLWPSVMASDPVLNTINGENNCVGGKVQYFRIKFYAQYRAKYRTCYKNSAYITYNYATKAGGVSRQPAHDNLFAGTSYCVGGTQLGSGMKYSVTIENLDAMNYNVPIENSVFELKKWNETSSSWEDYETFPNTSASGITTLENLPPEYKYKIVQVSVPAPYHLPFGTKYSTIPGSMHSVSPIGEFSIKTTDTTGILVLATNKMASQLAYDPNGGNGDMSADNVVAVRNNPTIVAKPTYSYPGHVFDSWNTKSNGLGIKYRPNEPIILNQDLTILYAQWTPLVTNISVGKKVLSGGTLAGYDYSFLITPLKDNGGTFVKDDLVATMTVQNTVNGDLYISSDNLAAGRWYHVKEIAGSDPDIKYDTSGYIVHYDNDRNVHYYKATTSGLNYNRGSLIDNNQMVFNNQYLTVPIPQPQDCAKATDKDGNEYESVRIGKYCWFTSNLRSTKYSDGREIANIMKYQSNMYPNINENVSVHGYLYDWYSTIDTAKNGVSPSTQVQGICPDGWFVPTEEQFADLYSNDAKTLNSPNHWIANAGTNETGFTALPSGRFNAQTGRYEDLGTQCWLMSCTPKGLSNSNSGNISYFCQQPSIVTTTLNDGYSVRCVRE